MTKHDPDSEASIALPAIALTETTGFARRLARSLTGLLTLFLLSLTLTPWQQNINGKGRVVAFAPLERQQTLQATVEGRVVKWWVREGSIVKAGDRIAESILRAFGRHRNQSGWAALRYWRRERPGANLRHHDLATFG